MGKGKPKSKGTKLQLGEFLGDNAGNTVNIGGKTVEMPSAPKAATLEIDITKVPNQNLVHSPLGNFFNWSISATDSSGLGLGIDKRFFAFCSCWSLVSRKIINFSPEVVGHVMMT